MATNRPLPGDITITGMDQKSQYQWMANITDAVNELRTLGAELRTDHATLITLTTANKTAVNALITAAGTTSASFAGLAAVTSVSAAAVATITAAALSTTDITLLRG